MSKENSSSQSPMSLAPNPVQIIAAPNGFSGIPAFPIPGQVNITWDQKDPTKPSSPYIYIAQQQNIVILDATNNTYTYYQNQYEVTDNNSAPIFFQVRPIPFDGTNVWAQQSEISRGSDPTNPNADTFNFDPGALVFVSNGQPPPPPLPSLQSLSIVFDTHDHDKDENTEISSTFESSAGVVLASFYMTNNAIASGGPPTAGPSGIATPAYFPLGQAKEYGMKIIGSVTPTDISSAVLKIYIEPHGSFVFPHSGHNEWWFRCGLKYVWSGQAEAATPAQEWRLSESQKNGQNPYNIAPQ